MGASPGVNLRRVEGVGDLFSQPPAERPVTRGQRGGLAQAEVGDLPAEGPSQSSL